MLRSIVHGVRRLVRRHDFERDLDDEVRFLLEEAARAHERAGLSPADAARAARLEFGDGRGIEAVKEEVRDAGWESHLHRLWSDLRYAARALRRTPSFTAVAALTLALGLGANVAMFCVANAVLLAPLPYAAPDRVALLWTDDTRRGLHHEPTAAITVDDWRSETRRFEAVAIFSPAPATLSVDGADATRVMGAFASADLFRVLGVRPALGRPFTDADERAREPVVVISHALWQRRFGGDSAVLGRVVTLDGNFKGGPNRLRVVGVMPAGFFFPDKTTELWHPATLYWRYQRESDEWFAAWARRWGAVGRLREGATVAQAQAEMTALGQRLARTHATADPSFPGFAVRVVPILEHVTGPELPRALWTLLGAVAFVLLTACANVANLTLARGAARARELAVRTALGASRPRLLRQLLVEHLLLAALAGALGLTLAWAITRGVAALPVAGVPRLEELRVDGRVVAFAAALSLATGLAFGLAPAWRLAYREPTEALNEGSGRATGGMRLRRTTASLVVAECALAVVLLSGAGLMIRSLLALRRVDPGFEPERALLVRVAFPRRPRLPEPPPGVVADSREDELLAYAARASVASEMVARVGALPGVEGAGFIDDLLLGGEPDESIAVPGRGTDTLAAGHLAVSSVTAGLLPTLGVRLLAGRPLARADAEVKVRALFQPPRGARSLEEHERRALAEPVVVNETFARRYFPGERAVGRRFCIDPTGPKTYWYEIVGVVGDMRRQGLEREPIAEYFDTFLPSTTADLVVRVRGGDPLAHAAAVRRVVLAAEPGTQVLDVTTVDRRLGESGARRRFQTALLAAFAALALALAATGIYGVVHYAVARRTREIGVRVAFGAGRGAVQRLVVAGAMRAPLLGLALGLLGAAMLGRLMTRLLFGIGALDPSTFLSVAAVLAGTALVACWLPARRAALVDPVVTLRED